MVHGHGHVTRDVPKVFDGGRMIISEGEEGNAFYLIRDGEVCKLKEQYPFRYN